jgi:hypothetical protein
LLKILPDIALQNDQRARLRLIYRDQLRGLEAELRYWYDAWSISTRDWDEVVLITHRLDQLDVEIGVTRRLIEAFAPRFDVAT